MAECGMSIVSVIVSTYNAERFLRGCLDDLLMQTLIPEIIVVNAGSKQDEARVLREYLERGVTLKIITSLREPLYASWNRAVRLATGDYVTPANTDDRHAPEALERLAAELDAHPEVGLVYADCWVTDTENAVFDGEYHVSKEPPYSNGSLIWPDFDPSLLLNYCYIGPQFMYRRALHETFGLFDESYLLAGDYEFALRLAAGGVQFRHVPQILGLFYRGGMSIANPAHSAVESYRAVLHWRQRITELERG